jgi:hypothetical protein
MKNQPISGPWRMTKFFGGARLCLQDQPQRFETLLTNGLYPRIAGDPSVPSLTVPWELNQIKAW